MDENAAESPMFNGDGVMEDQTPVEEESMTTTVMKDDSRINWPGSDGDSEGKPSEEVKSDDKTATSKEEKTPTGGDMDEQQEAEPPRYSLSDIEDDTGTDPRTDDIPPPITDDIPSPITDDIPPSPITDDIPPPITDDSPQSPDPAFTIADIPEPASEDGYDDDDPELQALADRDQEANTDSNTLELPDVQIIVTPGTPGPNSDSPTEFFPQEQSHDEDESSNPEDQSSDVPAAFEREPMDDVIIPEENILVETSPHETRDVDDDHLEDFPPSPPLLQDENKNPEELLHPVEDHYAPEPESQSDDDELEPNLKPEEPEVAGDFWKVPDESDAGETFQQVQDPNDEDLGKSHAEVHEQSPAEEHVESNKNGEDTDSGTISEGGSTPKHEPDAVISGFLPPPGQENYSQEEDQVEITPETAQEAYTAPTEDQSGEIEELIQSPETKEETENEQVNGKEPISAEAFFDEAFGSESADITDEPEPEEDKPPPIEEEAFAPTIKSDSSPVADNIEWPSEEQPEKTQSPEPEPEPMVTEEPTEPETPTEPEFIEPEPTVIEPEPTVIEPTELEPEPTVTEPEEPSTESDKMGVKGEIAMDTQQKNKENEEDRTSDKEGVDGPTSPTKDETNSEAVVSSPGSDNAEVVRAADEQAETKELTSPGGLRSVKDQFEGGNVSNVEVKKMMDDEVIRPTAIANEQAAPEGVNTSGISENEPVVRDDVVKAGTPSDDPMSVSGGTRSILDRFEKGEIVREDSEEDLSASSKKVDLTAEIEEARRREQELERADPGVSENTPVVRDDVVRADDASEDIKLEKGGLGSLKDRFEKGVVSNIEETPKKEPIKIGNLEDSNVNDPTHGTIAESTPIVRDDVVHSSDRNDEPRAKAGNSRSLKAMFEKGPVSNLEEKPKDKIELPREDDRPAESGISENTPVERDDVVKSTPVKDEPIKVGGLRNLKSMFEKGNVTNIEDKPRQVDHHTPSTLDSSAPSDGGISESTPEVREDLVRETSPKDDYKVKSGHSRSLKDRWEKGEVERPEANYKTVVMKEKEIIVESKPEPQREDVVTADDLVEPVQITAGSSKNLRERFETGEASNYSAGVTLRVAKDVPRAKRFSAYEPDAEGSDGQQHEDGIKEDVQNGSAETEAHENGVQNGGEEMEDQNGIIEDGMSPEENQKDSPQQEMASWEIKAARASALADSPVDGEDATLDH